MFVYESNHIMSIHGDTMRKHRSFLNTLDRSQFFLFLSLLTREDVPALQYISQSIIIKIFSQEKIKIKFKKKKNG